MTTTIDCDCYVRVLEATRGSIGEYQKAIIAQVRCPNYHDIDLDELCWAERHIALENKLNEIVNHVETSWNGTNLLVRYQAKFELKHLIWEIRNG